MDGSPQLGFKKDDILYVDNTMYNGVPGNWSAWVVDVEGKRGQWGIIPSKYKVDEELLMKRYSLMPIRRHVPINSPASRH